MSKAPRTSPPDVSANPVLPVDLERVVEMAELVAHEVNNLLNNMLLHVAVLDRKGLDAARVELAAIRQAGTRAGAMINRWQQLAPKRPVEWHPVDLIEVVDAVIASWKAIPEGRRAGPISFEPASELPPVLAHAADLEHLVQLLLLNAAAASARGTITVRTQAAPPEI